MIVPPKMRMRMSLAFIRRVYNVPAFRGSRVKALQRTGTITGADGFRIRVRLDGEKLGRPYHLSSILEYLPDGATK